MVFMCCASYNFVGLSNILYSARSKTISRGSPLQGSHRSAVAASLVPSELGTKVFEGVEAVGGVETFLVFAVTAFDLAVVTWRTLAFYRIHRGLGL